MRLPSLFLAEAGGSLRTVAFATDALNEHSGRCGSSRTPSPRRARIRTSFQRSRLAARSACSTTEPPGAGTWQAAVALSTVWHGLICDGCGSLYRVLPLGIPFLNLGVGW
jgi:hypothetical protein